MINCLSEALRGTITCKITQSNGYGGGKGGGGINQQVYNRLSKCELKDP